MSKLATSGSATLVLPFAPKKILIVRLSAIGDVVFASGLTSALQTRWPGVCVSWLTEAEHVDLLVANPAIDRVISWPKGRWLLALKKLRWLRLITEIAKFLGTLHLESYDLVLDTQGLLKSGIVAWLARGKMRVGLGSSEGSQWLMSHTVDRVTHDKLFGSEYRKLARYLGVPDAAFKPTLIVDPKAEDVVFRRYGRLLSQRFVVVAPFTTRPQKHWRTEHWRRVISGIVTDMKMAVIVLGGPVDQKSARQLIAGMPDSVVNLVGKTRLGEAMAVIRRAALMIGVDTGLSHMGVAFERPTILIFGATRPYVDHGDRRFVVLYEDLPCAPCRWRPSCSGRYDCMQQLAPERVVAAANALLDRQSSGA